MNQEHPKARAIDAADAETRELVDELSRREGVDALRAGPDGWLETSVEGPVTVLVVRD